MKSKIVGEPVTNNEDHARLRIFDGDLPLDEAGKELLASERQRAENYLQEKLDARQRYKKRIAELEAENVRLRDERDDAIAAALAFKHAVDLPITQADIDRATQEALRLRPEMDAEKARQIIETFTR